MEKKIFTVVCVIGRILMISSIAVLFLFGAMVGCEIYRSQPGGAYPDEGTWYCEELQIQISFDDPDNCYYIKDDEKLPCGPAIEHGGTGVMYILPRDNDSNIYDADNPILKCEYIWKTRKLFVVKDCETGQKYKFTRCTA